MARYVLACEEADYNPQAGTCAVEQWVIDEPAWLHMLPTMEESTIVGGGMFLAVCAVLAASLLLFGARDSSDD